MGSSNRANSSCGLDFGTSNSTIATINPAGEPALLPIEAGRAPMPSVLFFNFEDDSVHVGASAIEEYVRGTHGRMMRALKSVLGTSLMGEETRIKSEHISFVRVLELFLTGLHQRAETLGETALHQVVAGRPVRFVDDDDAADRLAEQQLREAMRGVGFGHVEFQFEPIAAALDYERRISEEELALVVDIGGGTSDFTIIRISPERAQQADRSADILATGGVHVGGTDLDRLLSMSKVMPLLGLRTGVKQGGLNLPIAPYYDLATWHRINRLYNRSMEKELMSTRQSAAFPERVEKLMAVVKGRYGHLLAAQVEQTKIELTAATSARFCFTQPQIQLDVVVHRDEFEASVAETLSRIPTALDELLRRAGLAAHAIQTLIMTGGSTQIPLLRTQLDMGFSGAKFVQTDAFGSVGLGLALDASRRF